MAPLLVVLLALSAAWTVDSGATRVRACRWSILPLRSAVPADGAEVATTSETSSTPRTPAGHGRQRAASCVKTLSALTAAVATSAVSRVAPARAIGALAEFKTQNMVLQDIAFNVRDTTKDAKALQALFQDAMKPLRTSTAGKTNTTVLAFGPDAYRSPKTFYPGVSTFYEDGGHATLTLVAQRLEGDDDVVELFERGNGLQYIKVAGFFVVVSPPVDGVFPAHVILCPTLCPAAML